MNKPYRYFFPAACIALLALAFIGLFAGCTPPAEERPSASASDLAQAVERALEERTQLYMLTTRPQIDSSEFHCITTDFDKHFAAHVNSTDQPFTDRSDTLFMDKLRAVLPAAPQPNGSYIRGLTFHYGLDTSKGAAQLKLALEFVKLVPHGDSVVHDIVPYNEARFYALEGKELTPKTRTAWMKTYHLPYLAAMRVKRNAETDPYAPLVNGVDHESFTFRWEGSLEEILKDNSNVHALVVWNVSEAQRRTETDEEDFRHNLAIHGIDSSYKVLLDTDPQTGFKMRGADLGSACPPNCVKALFYSFGLAIPSQCMKQR